MGKLPNGVTGALALLACLPVILFAKEAAGSGIPEVMGYLNGVHIRKLLRLRTLLAKIWGTVMIVSSGFAVGPEGPLVHTGAIDASVQHRPVPLVAVAPRAPVGPMRRNDVHTHSAQILYIATILCPMQVLCAGRADTRSPRAISDCSLKSL